MKTIRSIGQDYITLNITHRKQLLETCDRIYEYQNGNIRMATLDEYFDSESE